MPDIPILQFRSSAIDTVAPRMKRQMNEEKSLHNSHDWNCFVPMAHKMENGRATGDGHILNNKRHDNKTAAKQKLYARHTHDTGLPVRTECRL